MQLCTCTKIDSDSHRKQTIACKLIRAQICLRGATESSACIRTLCAELLLDSDQLVVLRQTLRSARCSGLDLTRPQTHDHVSDERVLRLSGTVRDHHTPTGLLRHRRRLD